ncbi:Pre-rRNA-processing protein IPI3 [Ceratobasidium theobromae]|uniref:Pre-rRNA-processing protein IPI3 n=1 Tax=Ceratobasidium theobromae TaxID=1582974 RepID=A0A5N5QUH4_9AGAM|nr:Pre-rRNA-processing protein IPI3 [Ceratobasidium theobromae]
MKLQETLLCGLCPGTPGSGSGHLALHELKTGATLATYKQSTSGVHRTSVVESQHGQGGFIISSQVDKPILNVYHFQKDQLAQRIVLPEKASCVASDVRGVLCAAGTPNGRIYLWECASGIMLNSWEAHFRGVHALKFTSDGAAIVSASEDSGVSVWSVASLVDNQLQHELPVPYCILSDHTLPILDVVCGVGLFPDCRLVTCSQDHTVKIWDLSSLSRPLLATFTFPHAIQAIVMDRAQRIIFASSASGDIYRIDLFKPSGDRRVDTAMVDITGDPSRVVPLAEHGQPDIAVGRAVGALAISYTSTLLLVGTVSGAILVYDLESHQLLRSITTHSDKGLSVAYLQCMLKPIDLQGHTTITDSGVSNRESIPLRPVVPFQRMRDARAREIHQVMVMIPPRLKSRFPSTNSNSDAELLSGQAYFLGSQSRDIGQSEVGQNNSGARVRELEAEIAQLRAALGQAKGINDSMWETMVNTILPKTNNPTLGSKEAATDLMVVDNVLESAKAGDGRKRARKTN